MRRLLITAALAAIASTPALAQNAKWKTVGQWEVWGNSQTQVCAAITFYPDADKSIAVGFADGNAYMDVHGVATSPGQQHNVNFEAGGLRFSMVGIGQTDRNVRFERITTQTVVALQRAKSIAIQGLGRFELAGSARAIEEAAVCYDTLNSF